MSSSEGREGCDRLLVSLQLACKPIACCVLRQLGLSTRQCERKGGCGLEWMEGREGSRMLNLAASDDAVVTCGEAAREKRKVGHMHCNLTPPYKKGYHRVLQSFLQSILKVLLISGACYGSEACLPAQPSSTAVPGDCPTSKIHEHSHACIHRPILG